MGRETGTLQLLAPLLLTGGKGADLVIRGDVDLNRHVHLYGARPAPGKGVWRLKTRARPSI
jgi:hypothetical protein